jgi:hypothetical protein
MVTLLAVNAQPNEATDCFGIRGTVIGQIFGEAEREAYRRVSN